MATPTEAIERVRKVFRVYDGEADSNPVDVLTDLLHYCEAEGRDFNDNLRMAREHFRAEQAGEF